MGVCVGVDWTKTVGVDEGGVSVADAQAVMKKSIRRSEGYFFMDFKEKVRSDDRLVLINVPA